jgi:hypothetical protein
VLVSVVSAAPATVLSVRLRSRVNRHMLRLVSELDRMIDDQRMHALQLWPRAWEGGRPLTQVEELAEAGKTWLGEPLDPEEQRRQMFADSARLLAEYSRVHSERGRGDG